VENLDTTQAALVNVAIALDPAFAIDDASGTGWSCSVSTPQQATCSRPSMAGETIAPAITVLATVNPAALPGPTTSTATVSAGSPDPDGTNNSDSATVTVLSVAVFRDGFEEGTP
jgi:hypothetical protein